MIVGGSFAMENQFLSPKVSVDLREEIGEQPLGYEMVTFLVRKLALTLGKAPQ